MLFGGLLAVARAAEGPLDDTDPARQRPGFLDAGPLPVLAPTMTAGFPADDGPSVVLLTRPDRLDRLCHALASHELDAVTVIVVAGRTDECAGTTVVDDPRAVIADRYGMREPRGGGPPVGYAVVDAEGLIRYRTLDPAAHDELSEVSTILEAVR